MQQEQIRKLFAGINVWKRGGERAPHKPLLLLYSLAKCERGEPREMPFSEVNEEVRKLLVEFGPVRKSYHPEYPFWHLQSDGLWKLKGAEGVKPRKSNTNASRNELLKHNVYGGFTEQIYDALHNNPRLLSSIAHEILDRNFPASIHDDILTAVGLETEIENIRRKRRNPNFRNRVLIVYEYRCAVCNFDLRIGNTPLGLEAAHIKWHQAGGPDIESNGLALCSIHHKMLDRGAFTLSDNLRIEISEHVNGIRGLEEWLLIFHGKLLRTPQTPSYIPAVEYLQWHRREVFRAPARYLNDADQQ